MGCTTSSTATYVTKEPIRLSTTETKLKQALLKKKMEGAISEKKISFEKILLKFDKMREVVGYVKKVFEHFATDGKLDHKGLETTMKRLGVDLPLDDLLDMFDFIDVQEVNAVSLKEFLVALTIGQVLDIIPALSVAADDGSSKKVPIIRRSFSGFLGHNSEIKEMLHLIVEAYLIFDPDGVGYIERSGIEKMLEEHGANNGSSSNAMLSQQRWDEMDWDANGTIDFAEFVYAFSSWVDIGEPEE